MKCQKCAKPTTYHITDIERGKPHEYHFCDEHAREHLDPAREPTEAITIGKLAEKLIKGSTDLRKTSATDKQTYPLCRTSFLEFRNSEQLSCPHDYDVFRDEMMPLLEN